ncbi:MULTISPECIES: threonine aldolase family protein [Halocynthiibacter]|uniref:Low specificity L-threonine aldolase n=1 Tax=Halocynthiibacter halioticoli TaxID=2986804 RepID=A0AAE3LQM2_9RHOB|nr:MULTISPECIES: low specificity L-threonine aldolase [Halocynthiibacter]MCV6823693.1 low specificity L-threonine aldolase [Halocynthiibacter halioticoli]MCW4056694.1 low specificity L-threonine aldolase [Halocynthiibacter sp. SDUM655004]
MFFESDNSGPAHPSVLAALSHANEGYASAYGSDPLSAQVSAKIRELFEAPKASVYLVATGTAANSLILSTITKPFETIFCSNRAHIHEDECNAPEFFTGGAKLTLVPTTDGKMTAGDLEAKLLLEENRGVHGPQRGPVSITQITETGSIYSLEEIRSITGVATQYGLSTHMDGARFANAVATLGCSPAEMSWEAGIDCLSFGGTKNGLLGVEAAIFFNPELAAQFELRRKRAAHLFSKNRYLAAQMQAYLTDDLWLKNAEQANATTAYLAEGLRKEGAEITQPIGGNIIFANLPRATHKRLKEGGAKYHIMSGTLEGADPDEPLLARFVCDWSIDRSAIDQFLGLFKS